MDEWQLRAASEGDPNALDFIGFGDCQRILEFNIQVPNRALHFGVPEGEAREWLSGLAFE
ncbi:hypothetical protein KDD17_14495 [Sulfitobacter albidus]|uniref:Uncharacterized protein n=1 Tax=Sulfitobacter albidus TaxID=2829501 RepID=A0A975PM69_9RHOB|nr:hypothetical protein [Sulfitobacter albidus]QUJ76116.1 hypothetical protein KDD17_14495 [Sulfitobacter albidus]